jgi:hypothetical protein
MVKTNSGIRIIDLIQWGCMLALAAVLLWAMCGCGTIDRSLTVAEKALEHADDVKAAGAEIRSQVEDEDWFGLTESILIGAGGVLAAVGGRQGYKKWKSKEV